MTEPDGSEEQQSTGSTVSGGAGPAFVVSVADGITHIKPTRKPTTSEILAFAVDLITSGSHPRRLWDYSDMNFPFSIEELKLLADGAVRLNESPCRIATLVSDDLGYGSMRVFAAHFTTEQAPMMVFRDGDAALRWLKQD